MTSTKALAHPMSFTYATIADKAQVFARYLRTNSVSRYGGSKRLNEQVRSKAERFPGDFAFLLSSSEWEMLRFQIAASTGRRAPYRRFLPYVFTERGALMAAGLLKSPRAIEVSIYVARASVIWDDG